MGGRWWFGRGGRRSCGDGPSRPLFRNALLDGTLPAGYAVWDRVMLHFDGTTLVGAVSSQDGARAIYMHAVDGQINEAPIDVTCLPSTGTGGVGPSS